MIEMGKNTGKTGDFLNRFNAAEEVTVFSSPADKACIESANGVECFLKRPNTASRRILRDVSEDWAGRPKSLFVYSARIFRLNEVHVRVGKKYLATRLNETAYRLIDKCFI